MTSINPPGRLPEDLAKALAAARDNPADIFAAMQAGERLHTYGFHDDANRFFRQIVAMLKEAIANGAPPDPVCALLLKLYSGFVKKVEAEHHTRACFQSWLPEISRYGRQFQDTHLPRPLWQPAADRPWRPAFVLLQAAILGHTEAMMELIAHRPRLPNWADPVVYTLEGSLPDLNRWGSEHEVRIVNLEDQIPGGAKYLAKLQLLRRRMAEDGISHLVWVSAPVLADFALSMRLAPRQVFWTLKFHPFRIPEIDGYVTYGAWSERTRLVHGEEWQVVPFMLSQASSPVADELVVRARAQFPQHRVLFGTLARTEKMNSPPYLDAVARILKDNPGAGFLWTGRERHPGIQQHFQRAGVAERCHFIGWIQTPLYARVLDIFLESFPFGCGLTGIQALEAGTALVSYEAPETQFGMHFMRPLQEGGEAAAEIRRLLEPQDQTGPLIYARDVDAYVAAASRLARDADFRRAVGLAGQAYFRRYLTNSAAMAERFYAVLETVRKPEEGSP